MALDACVKEVLCTLSTAALDAVVALLTPFEVIINGQILALQSSILQLDVAAGAVNAVVGLGELAVGQVEQIFDLIPTVRVQGCLDLGEVMLGLDAAFDQAFAWLDDFRTRAIRYVSLRGVLQASVDALNSLLIDISDIRDLIGECIADRSTA